MSVDKCTGGQAGGRYQVHYLPASQLIIELICNTEHWNSSICGVMSKENYVGICDGTNALLRCMIDEAQRNMKNLIMYIFAVFQPIYI